MKERHDNQGQADLLDLYLRRDVESARRSCPEAVVERVLDSMEAKSPAPIRNGAGPWRLERLAAAGLFLLAAGAVWFARLREAREPVEEPNVTSVIEDAQPSDWLAPSELLAGLERGAKLEQERLVRDLDRVQEAVLGELAVTLQAGSVFTSRPR